MNYNNRSEGRKMLFVFQLLQTWRLRENLRLYLTNLIKVDSVLK
jgi:hypothetical protein